MAEHSHHHQLLRLSASVFFAHFVDVGGGGFFSELISSELVHFVFSKKRLIVILLLSGMGVTHLVNQGNNYLFFPEVFTTSQISCILVALQECVHSFVYAVPTVTVGQCVHPIPTLLIAFAIIT
jgi:hypothetical protein